MHKLRNVADKQPDDLAATVMKKMRAAYQTPSATSLWFVGTVKSACETNDRATVVNNTDQSIVVGSYGTSKRYTDVRLRPHGTGIISIGALAPCDSRKAIDPAGSAIKTFKHVCVGDEITIRDQARGHYRSPHAYPGILDDALRRQMFSETEITPNQPRVCG